MGFARDFARFGVSLACISSALWTEPTETTIAQTPGSEEPEYGIATPLALPCRVATEMGEVRGMHAVPHTLAGVVYCDKDEKSAWDEALKTSKRAMEPGQTRESNPFQCIS